MLQIRADKCWAAAENLHRLCLSGTRLPLQTPFGTWLHTHRPQEGETVPDQTAPAFVSRQIKDQMDEVWIKSRIRMRPSLRQTQSSMTNRRLTSNRDPICGSRLSLLCVWSQKLLTERKGRAEAVWGSLEEKHAGCGWIPPHYNPSTVCLCGDECYTSGLSRSHACKAHKQTHTEPFIKKPPRPHNALKGAVSSHTPKYKG